MNKLNALSIRNKLVLIQVLTSVLVLAIFAIIFISTQISSFKSRMATDLYSIAGVVAQNSIAPLQFQDNDAARKMLVELQAVSPDIRYGAILDGHKGIFADAARNDADTQAFRTYRNSIGTFFTANNLIVVRTFGNNGADAGTVYLQAQLNELTAMKREMLQLAGVLGLITLAAAFIISFALQSYISTRLLDLVGVMQRVSRTGEYVVPLSDEGNDEISILIRVFKQLLSQIGENEKRKDEFIGVASHELKTPLTNVKGYLEILQSIEDRESNRQLVERAFINAKKLEKLIADLLDVSRIQSGQLQLNLSSFDLDELIEETIASTQMLAKERTVVFEARSGTIVRADRQRIEQVLLNLLSNAVKYSTETKPIQVMSFRTDAQVLVEVADFGPGVATGEESSIFNRFYRSKDVSPHISGFGLGLYICSDIIIRHKGRIWVKNRVDGASFFFQLLLSGPDEENNRSLQQKPINDEKRIGS